MTLKFEQVTANSTSFSLSIASWHVKPQQSWGVMSTGGDVGSLLGDLLCAQRVPCSGRIEANAAVVAQVSLVEQQRLLELELANDDSDLLDGVDPGRTVFELVYQQCHDRPLTERLLHELQLQHLAESGFKWLSTGETRRLMLARALAIQPDLLVLDEPYAGLDVAHRAALTDYLKALSLSVQLLVIVSRETDMPEWVEHVALFNRGQLEGQMAKAAWDQHPLISQIKAQSQQQSQQMMTLLRRYRHRTKFANPLFQLTDGKVAYTDQTIFSGVNWRIDNAQHWQVIGPNGCGKSTLLGLIFGDHPQCYSNTIQLFGKRRGSGESIWELKQHMGMVSSALHLQYRVDSPAIDVIVSGFYDSIGLYQKPTQQELEVGREWLTLLHMSSLASTSFRQLEYGQQRLLLIARALVKQPTLLILDEPYQGLDYLGRRLVKSTLELIAKENLSQLLYVSHYEEDQLTSINNYLRFVPNEHGGGYRVEIEQAATAL